MTGEDVPEDSKARAAKGGGLPARRSDPRLAEAASATRRLTIVDVEAVAWELGVSRSTTYRLIIAYRAKGNGVIGRAASDGPAQRCPCVGCQARTTDRISAIQEIYLKPERPTMTYLIEQVRARCAQKTCRYPTRPPDDQGARRSHRSAEDQL